MKYIFKTVTIIIFILTLCSCNKNEIEDLEQQIEALEKEGRKFIILTDVTARSQSAINFLGEEKIRAIKGVFTISGHDIVDLSPLDSLKEVGSLIVSNNSNLKGLTGIENLKYVEHNLSIYDNDSLRNLNGLNGIEYIKGEVRVTSNNVLKDFCGIKQLWKNEVIFNLSIYANENNPDSWKDITNCD